MNIGFVGLGAMGAGIVPRLMAAGHAVTGWNRSKQKAEPLIAAMKQAPSRRRSGPRRIGEILPAILARLGVPIVKSQASGETDLT